MNTPVWEDGNWQRLPALEQDLQADVCVIGLGSTGLTAIHELLKAGKTVIGLDAAQVAGAAAGRNGGFLLAGTAAFYHEAVQQLGREQARALYQLSLSQMDAMTAATPEAIQRIGSLRIASSADELADCQQQYKAMTADKLPVERYEGPEGQGLLFPEDGTFNPLLRCRLLAQQALAAGALLFEDSPVQTITGELVQTPCATIHCKHVIVAVDGRLEQLLPELKGKVRTARLQMLATEPTAEVHIPRPVYARYGYEYWQQRPDKRIALGGFRDKALNEEWTINAEPSPRIQAMLESFLRHELGIQAAISHRWAASVAYSKGILPYFGEVRPGVWAMGGYSGTGNVMGALCGLAAAQAIAYGGSELAAYLQN